MILDIAFHILCCPYWVPLVVVDGMQPARLKRTTSHTVPHICGVVASIGTLSRVGVYTLARACASALSLWRKHASQPIC